MKSTFDLNDLDDLVEPVAIDTTEVGQWAEEQLSKCVPDGDAIWDIETGPRPLAEIECFYTPPEALPPFDESSVKYGNMKDPAKRAEKLAAVRAEYQSQLDNEAAARQAHMAEWLSKAALSPVTGRVLLAGMLIGGKPWFCDNSDERKLLEGFWAFVDESLANKTRLIGHNSNGFDLPFMVRRSWCLGVPVPREVRQGRYWNPLFVDTMEVWGCGSREFVSLDTLGQFFGVGQKTEGVNGGDFAKLWFGTPEEHTKAIEYNEQDLRLTAAIAAKMGVA